MSTVVLYQYGDDPLKHHFIDSEGRPSFTFQEVGRDPNLIVRLSREPEWFQAHTTIKGPDKSFFYLGPENAPGWIGYGGNNTRIPMPFFLRHGKKDQSLSRYFRCLNGTDYKWKIGSHRMECLDGKSLLAVWEVSTPDQEYYAKLSIRPNAMPLITEIVTALICNRLALAFSWP